MGRKSKKKNGETTSKKQKTSHDPNKNHQASLPDGWTVLPNVVRHSGLLEAFVVAKEFDLLGRPGSDALDYMMSNHQVTLPGGQVAWEQGPASWMKKAIEVAEKKDKAKFLEFFEYQEKFQKERKEWAIAEALAAKQKAEATVKQAR